MSVVAAIVASNEIILIEGELDNDGCVTVLKDETLVLEKGERHLAYSAMRTRLRDRLSRDVECVILKASSGGQYAARTAILNSAELRGVFLCSIPDNIKVVQRQKKSISRGRSRKLDEYTKDDAFFLEKFKGAPLRKGSRECAFLIFNEGD